MDPLYNVNDNAHTENTTPSGDYNNINDTSNSNPTILNKRNKNLKDFIQIGLMIIILLVLLVILIFGVKFNDTKDIGQETVYTSDTSQIDTHNVEMNVYNYQITNNSAEITISIKNNSSDNIYLTAKGIYLTSDNNVYCPNVVSTNNASKFYGRPIEKGETVTAIFTYNNIKDNPTNLVVSNVIDEKNLAWTNVISIK